MTDRAESERTQVVGHDEVAERRPPVAAPPRPDLDDSSLYFNRERSWLDIHDRVSGLRGRLAATFERDLRHALAEHGIRLISIDSANSSERAELEELFENQIFPTLTPLVIGHGRPFPYISNLSLSLGVVLRDPDQEAEVLARVKVPKELLRRFLTLGDGRTFVALEDMIAHNLGALFPGMEVVDHALFRVTRDTDYDISDEADDLLQAVEDELRRRRFGEVVRL